MTEATYPLLQGGALRPQRRFGIYLTCRLNSVTQTFTVTYESWSSHLFSPPSSS